MAVTVGKVGNTGDTPAKAEFFNTKDMAYLTNKSGGQVTTGDVLVLDTTTGNSFTTTTTAGDLRPVFVVPTLMSGNPPAPSTMNIATDAADYVYKAGAYVPLANVDGAVSIGEYLKLSGTAKKFTGTGIIMSATAAPPLAARAYALESAAVAGQIAVKLLDATSPGIYPQRALMLHFYSNVLTGNPLTLSASASSILGTAYQNPAADADSFEQSFMLKAGNYTLRIIGATANNMGKIDWTIDDVAAISGQDWYSAAPAYNVVKTGAVTIVGTGRHVLKGVVNGKNPVSDYYIQLSSMDLYPADDTKEVA